MTLGGSASADFEIARKQQQLRRYGKVRVGPGRRANVKGKTNVCSIFGQIEGVVANAMVEEGLVRRIEPDDIPPSVRYNDKGERAHCALVFSTETERAFDLRVAKLRA